ncbi:MAG: hypothetical protein HY294_10625 [Candidatus Rokubacteria bacterium]|nr:hypothetical protein [Candidatus Rokubacteria bacterium]MBI3826438.1 hypothetical protein [Candidatus Rokubacteria bacterium]
MRASVLVTGAGGGAGNSLLRSLRAGDRELRLLGCHHDRFALKKSEAERNFLVHDVDDPRFVGALARLAARERVDCVIPTTDAEVRLLSARRRRLRGRLFLPRHDAVVLCQDKLALARALARAGVPVAETYPVTSLATLDATFAKLGRHAGVWCRIRTGHGSRGALPVASAAQARAWIEYWRDMRGVRPASFTLSELLPGRDFFAQGIWRAGRLVLLKTCERLSYFGAGNSPSGMSSVSALSKTVHEPEVARVCRASVAAVDRTATGAFNLDLKARADGTPCVTEINAGRFASGTALVDLAGKHNTATTYVRLALGEAPDIGEPYDVVEDCYSLRDLDTLPGVFPAEELFEGIIDARG